MTKSQLLDELARILDSEPYKGRWGDAQKAFAEYTASPRRPWWKFWGVKITPKKIEAVFFDDVSIKQIKPDGSLGEELLTNEDYEGWGVKP